MSCRKGPRRDGGDLIDAIHAKATEALRRGREAGGLADAENEGSGDWAGFRYVMLKCGAQVIGSLHEAMR